MKITSADCPGGHVGDPTMESQIYSAITGKEMDEPEMLEAGERIFNIQRAVLLRQGWGGRKGDRLLDYFFTESLKQGEVFFNPDALMPGHNGEVISRLGLTLDRTGFENMKSEYYLLRGWDAETGFPTREKLADLDMTDVADDLLQLGLCL
jgi:aldehyde:ferredoxin oxidoreductase